MKLHDRFLFARSLLSRSTIVGVVIAAIPFVGDYDLAQSQLFPNFKLKIYQAPAIIAGIWSWQAWLITFSLIYVLSIFEILFRDRQKPSPYHRSFVLSFYFLFVSLHICFVFVNSALNSISLEAESRKENGTILADTVEHGNTLSYEVKNIDDKISNLVLLQKLTAVSQIINPLQTELYQLNYKIYNAPKDRVFTGKPNDEELKKLQERVKALNLQIGNQINNFNFTIRTAFPHAQSVSSIDDIQKEIEYYTNKILNN